MATNKNLRSKIFNMKEIKDKVIWKECVSVNGNPFPYWVELHKCNTKTENKGITSYAVFNRHSQLGFMKTSEPLF